MKINQTNPVEQLLIASTEAEFAGDVRLARSLIQQAWNEAQSDLERCMAAHYQARYQTTAEQRLMWNQVAMRYAESSDDPMIATFLPSLERNLEHSYAECNHE
ncbi:MAG: hypothetical protein KAX40_12190 [Herpetosiphon sp.]|nr:hypothetical protein [Herpetosiphon sp.]